MQSKYQTVRDSRDIIVQQVVQNLRLLEDQIATLMVETNPIHETHMVEGRQNKYNELVGSCLREKAEMQQIVLTALDALMLHKQKNYGFFDKLSSEIYQHITN